MDQTSEFAKALLMLWGDAQRNAGRMDAVCDYLRHCKDVRGYMNSDDAAAVLAMIGAKPDEIKKEINETDEEINETENEDETE